MSDEDIWRLNRGGHDPHKIYAAYAAASRHAGQPTVILAKTVKGYGMGKIGEAKNPTHQLKKLDTDAVREFRDRFRIPLTDDKLGDLPFYRLGRGLAGDEVPAGAASHAGRLPAVPAAAVHRDASGPRAVRVRRQLGGTPGREISTTMAFVRILNTLLRDKAIGPRVVPIVPDESRTFGMEGMFRQFGIFSQGPALRAGGRQPADVLPRGAGRPDAAGGHQRGRRDGVLDRRRDRYSTSDMPMIPFYIFYSMFGFQRVMDLIWAAGDSRARGFLLGGTAGRTTLNGEGLQHEDGHSHVLASVVPNCVSYDPTYSYEVAVIVHDGLRRMVAEQEDVFFYVTLMNENYEQPALPEGAEAGILRGMYLLRPGSGPDDGPACSCWAAGPSCGRCWPGRTCCRPTTAYRPTCGAPPASPSCGGTGSPPSGRTCCTRVRNHGAATWRSAWPGGPAR